MGEVSTGWASRCKEKHFHTGKMDFCRGWGLCEFVQDRESVCVSRLPEVGDLVLSMSMDCWLSESSVRPVAANGSREKEEVERTKTVRLSQFGQSDRMNRSQFGWHQPRHTQPKKELRQLFYQKNMIASQSYVDQAFYWCLRFALCPWWIWGPFCFEQGGWILIICTTVCLLKIQ